MLYQHLSEWLLLGGVFLFLGANFMNKEKKIGTGVAVLIILIFGAFFLIFQTSPKENSSPPNPAGKASLVAILEINGEKYESEITAGENIYDFMAWEEATSAGGY